MRTALHTTPCSFVLLRVVQDGSTALHDAARRGNFKVASLLVDAGAALHARVKGETPLHLAVAEGRREICRLLVDAHAPLDAINHDGRTPLHIAARAGSLLLVSMLMDAGATNQIKSKVRAHATLGCRRGSSKLLERARAA
mgnify:CR=1 FL=1